jgi:predicted DNA-binding transcriptional regulator AlpA
MGQIESPLISVSEAAREILRQKPVTVYDKIAKQVFPPGVVVRLGDRSIRFHREHLLRWIEAGGTAANGVGRGESQAA